MFSTVWLAARLSFISPQAAPPGLRKSFCRSVITSAAEEVQRAFPDARVVGAFKNVWWEVFDAPRFGGMVSDVFVVGDDDQAKRRFLALVEGMPFRFLDAGRLQNARTVERMTLLSGELGQRQGYFPRMNYRLLGEPWSAGRDDRFKELIASR